MSDQTRDGGSDDDAEAGAAVGQALQPELAFVVQLRSRPARNGRRLQGRVEHVVSGATLRFDSTAELIEFLTRGGAAEPTSSED
jgi:hypothetical protein